MSPLMRPRRSIASTVAENRAREAGPWPGLDLRLVEWLEEIYPPRCKRPNESLEEHMLYAGRVALVSDMRARLGEFADFTTAAVVPENGFSESHLEGGVAVEFDTAHDSARNFDR